MTSGISLTAEQRRIVELKGGAHLVIAPPGSGKTQVLIERIIFLIRSTPSDSFRILALTFTTRAAEELRARVERVIGAEEARRVTAATFHAFCLDVLQHYGEPVGFVHDTTIYESEEDRAEVLREALQQEGLPSPDEKQLGQVLQRIGQLKRALTAPESLKDTQLSTAYAAYNRVLRQYRGCDFDDLLWLSWRLLTESPRIARHYRRLYRFIMVDEAQDTSRAQYEILRALAQKDHGEVLLVADSDQFIYRFAGASSRWLQQFEKDFSASVHVLVSNFRSAQAIIDAASKLIAESPDRVPGPRMQGEAAPPGWVGAVEYPNEAAEAAGVVDWLAGLLRDGLPAEWIHQAESASVAPEQLCVLGRNRYCLDAVVRELDTRGMEHVFTPGRRGLVESAAARLAWQGLRILHNPADLVTRESVVATWSDSDPDGGLADLPTDRFLRELDGTQAPEGIVRVLRRHADRTDVSTLVPELLDALAGYDCGEEEANALLVSDVRILRERWESYRGRTTPSERELSGFLGELSLAGRSVVEGPGIRVLTIHAAKGLEFKAVALVGMNEGTLPDYRSVKQDTLAEEYRIGYVAVSRASRGLLLTRPRMKRMPWGDDRLQQESRLIGKMGLTMRSRS